MNKVTVYIPMDKWLRGSMTTQGGWGNGSTGCASTFIQKACGVMEHFGPEQAETRLDRTVLCEVIRINDDRTTPDNYKQQALQALLGPYDINLVFVEPAVRAQPVIVRDDEALVVAT
jgi:hypothetical protein